MCSKKAVLAFSGGLDTSYCAVYLRSIKGYEVHAVTVNTGGFTGEEISAIEAHAYSLGVHSFKCIDAREDFYQKVIRYLVFGNVLKNDTYPLSVSAERITQAIAIAEYTKLINAGFVAHGSTGAGNDQVRFDMVFNILIPDVKILTPIRDRRLTREEEVEFLMLHGIEMDGRKAAYSINKGIWGTSVGGSETLTSHLSLPEEAYPTQLSRQDEEMLTLHYEKGELKGVNEEYFNSSVDAILRVQEITGPFAIGRDIHVGDTIIGIKGRVGFEAAAPITIIKAHHTLEKHTLTKWQLFLKDQLSSWYGNWLHEGQYLDPVMRDIEQFLQSSQQNVTGKVFVHLAPYRFQVTGIESPFDLMSDKFGSYGEMNRAWTGEDVKGFTRIFGNQPAIFHQLTQLKEVHE